MPTALGRISMLAGLCCASLVGQQPILSVKGNNGRLNTAVFVPGSRLPVWNRGSLLYFEGNGTSSPIIHALDGDGSDSPAALVVPGATTIHIDHLARNSSGALGAVGMAFDAGGRGAPYLATISSDRQMTNIVRTSPYIPQLIAFGEDDTIWTKGWEPTDINDRRTLNSNAGALRHFDARGQLMGSFLPQGAVDIPRPLFTSPWGFLVTSSSTVGWEQGDTGPYYEITLATQSVQAYPGVPFHKHELLLGMALTENGFVFAGTGVSTRDSDISPGDRLYALDRGRKVWRVVTLPPLDSGPVKTLLGSDANVLVLRSKDPGINWLVGVQ